MNSFLSLRSRVKASLLVLTATLFLSSCGSSASEEPLTRDYATYVGEFKSLGNVEVREDITHLFETDEGEILYSYSERYNLDDEDYFGQRVEAYGVVMTYESLDKPVFEVKMISEAPEKDISTEETVTDVDYQDPDLGFFMTYPSNWALTVTPTSVILEAPQKDKPEVISDEESATEEAPIIALPPVEDAAPDSIVILRTDAQLEKTSDDSQDDRATEVRSYVQTHYPDLGGMTGELSYVGTDRLFGIRYKLEDGDTFYFVPRSNELFELSYYHESEDDTERLENSNVFASLVNSFRFTTYGESQPEEATEDPSEESPESSSNSTEQVEFSKYAELQSGPYAFKMSYPSSWYYSGTTEGYYFDDEAIDGDVSGAILSLTLSSSGTVGTARSGETVAVTVEVDGRYFTLQGPLEYENVMKKMTESIQSTKE